MTLNLDRWFRVLVYAQVMLGLAAFCMADRSPMLMLIAGGLGAASWYLTQGPNGRPLSRGWINFGSVCAMGVLAWELLTRMDNLVVAMGHFTMILQLLMLYARKSPREYAMLLVLSLLQMVGASVLSVSVGYGLFLLAYCVVALLTVLLFQLRSLGDTVEAWAASAAPPGTTPIAMRPTAGRRFRVGFRRTALTLFGIAAAIASVVFVVMPRSGDFRGLASGGGPGHRRVGFADHIQLGRAGPAAGAPTAVMNVALSDRGDPIGGAHTSFLLRGAVLDRYDRRSGTWSRSPQVTQRDRGFRIASADGPVPLLPMSLGDRLNDSVARSVALRMFRQPGASLDATVTLRSGAHVVLFSPVVERATGGAVRWFESEHLGELLFSPLDGQLTPSRTLPPALSYDVSVALVPSPRGRVPFPELEPAATPTPQAWRGMVRMGPASDGPATGSATTTTAATATTEPPADPPENWLWHALRRLTQDASRKAPDRSPAAYASGWDERPEDIGELARSILTQAGVAVDADGHASDPLRAASAIAGHLQRTFDYRLGVDPGGTDAPVADFLLSRRTGHCELFAAGFVALCRTVGLPARIVTGYRVSEFNQIGGYYVVRQNHAHAWAEVWSGQRSGWRTFDPTPDAEVRAEHRIGGPAWFDPLRHLYEHIEFTWIRNIVAFDERTRQVMLARLRAVTEAARERIAVMGSGVAARWRQAFNARSVTSLLGDSAPATLGGAALIAAAVVLVGRLLVQRQRRQRRTRRLGDSVRPDTPAFLVEALEWCRRAGFPRTPAESGRAFAGRLGDRLPAAAEPIRELVRLAEAVRFGGKPLDPTTRAEAEQWLRRLRQLRQPLRPARPAE